MFNNTSKFTKLISIRTSADQQDVSQTIQFAVEAFVVLYTVHTYFTGQNWR